MPKFVCEFCQSKIKVPDEYVGKRVKCPGCAKPIKVPGGSGAGGGLDLSLLDDSLAGDAGASAAPRKLRSMVLGCAACGKTIHIPENRVGTVTPCPKCKVPLNVDRMELPATSGNTIDLKHIELEPAGEPSLLGDTSAGGSLAGLTGTAITSGSIGGTRGGTSSGSRVGGSMSGSGAAYINNAKDQMAELRALNDLKASGAISDEVYRQRKAAIYSGAESASLARQAMSRSAAGSSEKAIRVDMSSSIPAPLKWLIAVGVVALGVFLVWEFGLKPVIWGGEDTTQVADAEAEAAKEAERRRREEERRAAEEARLAAEQAEPEPPLWYELMPDLGEEALATAMVMPGVPGVFAEDEGVFADASASNNGGALPLARVEDSAPLPPTNKRGSIAYWDLVAADTSSNHPLARRSAFVRELRAGTFDAKVGVGIGPRANFGDMNFKKFQNELRQELYNGLARVADFGEFKPDIRDDRPVAHNGVEFTEVIVTGSGLASRGERLSVLTGVQDGYCVFYWFHGPNRMYKRWQQEAVGNATIE